jgi:steroid delta-isomerase-like uncharacterized protein
MFALATPFPLARRDALVIATAVALGLTSFAAQPAFADDMPAIAYTDWSAADPVPQWEEPTAAVGTVDYNLWLGRMFNGVLFNTADPVEQERIAGRIVHEDYIQHNLLVAQGRQGILDFMPYLFSVMPDTRFYLHDVIATEDRVITRWTWTGTITGPEFLGVPGNGQRFEMDGIDIWTLKDGMLYEHWDQFDWPRAFAELGIDGLPAPFYGVASQPVSR